MSKTRPAFLLKYSVNDDVNLSANAFQTFSKPTLLIARLSSRRFEMSSDEQESRQSWGSKFALMREDLSDLSRKLIMEHERKSRKNKHARKQNISFQIFGIMVQVAGKWKYRKWFPRYIFQKYKEYRYIICHTSILLSPKCQHDCLN